MSWWDSLTNKPRGVFGGVRPEQSESGDCDHRSIRLRQGTAEYEWFVARGELETTKNLKHGASHLANLLSYDPARRDWLELLERYLEAAQPDPEALIPRGEQLYYATEALRAYIWHKQGRLHEALNLLCQVTNAKQSARYLEAWALDWLEPAGTVQALPKNLGLFFFSLGLNRHNEAAKSTPARVAAVQRYAALLERFAPPHANDGMISMLQVGLHRKAGSFDRALEIAQAALKSNPNWHTATALGLVLRYSGDPDKAEKAFLTALEMDPQDVSARLEAGDTFFDIARYDTALSWYESALAAEPGQPWARPSALFCRWKLTGDAKHIKELIELARAEPSKRRASDLWDMAYGAGLPEPGDASANLLRQFREQILTDPAKAPTGAARMTLSSLEAPSNYVAFRLEMEALKHDLTLQVVSSHVPTPDPRQPIAPVKYLLWKYDGFNARPGLPPPDAEVASSVAQIAGQSFDYDRWWAAAARVAHRLGTQRVEDILAVLVHPPALPDDMTALAWLPRIHFAACAILAQLDSGWEESVRRAALLSVLHGPMDWTTEAAVRALAYLGHQEEPLAPDIHDEFQRLYDHRPSHGHWGWYRTLLQCWQWLPHLYDSERDAMRKQLAALDEKSKEEEEQE